MLRSVGTPVGGWGGVSSWVVLVVLIFPPINAAGQPPATKPAVISFTQSQREALKWFDGLGFPDLKNRQLVRVATGRWSQSGDEPPQNRYVLAFLLKSEGDRFTVIGLDLDLDTLKSTPLKTPEHQQVGYEKLDLQEQAAAYVKSLRAMREKNKDEPSWHFGPYLPEDVQVFVLARACLAAGLQTQARELLDFAEELSRQEAGENQQQSLRETLAQRIAHKEMWQAVLAFGELDVTRKELLARFERIVKHFPESEHAERAAETAEMLRKMVREDEELAKQAKPLEKMTVQERVAALVFRLRDQNGQQWSQPGSCDVFLDPRGEKSPAHQLVKMGFDAVPALLDALGDRRFTRSVGYHRDFYFSHYVLRVGDCARAVLEQIAGRRFYRRGTTSSEMSTDEADKQVQRQVRDWWVKVQKNGEKQVLIESVEVADENSPAQAKRLLEKFPDAALAAITRGAVRTEDVWIRERLIELAAEIKGDAPVPFLLQQMKQGSARPIRVAAARGLLKRKRPEALKAMIDEWKKFSSSHKNGNDGDDGSGVEGLIGLLAASGSPEAVHALAEGLREHSVDVKLAVVSAFGPAGTMSVFATGCNGLLAPVEAKAHDETLVAAIEDLLIGSLDDKERRMGMSATWGDKSFSDPQIGDVAGHVLWTRWPKKYTFDIGAPAAMRDRQRVELKNIWRMEHGLPPLELPRQPQIQRMGEEELQPLWDAVLHAADEENRGKAVSIVEARGLESLPAARKLLAAVPADAPSRPALEMLVRRLSVAVREVVVEEKKLPEDHPFAKALRSMSGKPFTAEQFVELLLAYTRQPPAQLSGIMLSVERPGDDTGVVVRFSTVGQADLQPGGQKSWEHSMRVTAGRKALLGSSGSGSPDYLQKANAYRDFARALDEALSRPPDEPLEAIITVAQQR